MTVLHLDTRQRAMLEEMGIHVWLPEPVVVKAAPAIVPVAAAATPPPRVARIASQPPPPPARPAEPVRVDFSHIEIPNRQADWFILGDVLETDTPAIPEVQSALVLLDNILKAAGLSRTESGARGAYCSSAAQHRTSRSVKPDPDELEHCRPFVAREIAAVRPRVIMAMGTFAIQLALQEHPAHIYAPIEKQRGTVYRYQGIPVIPTYSPRNLLRSGSNKAKTWADWCLALETYPAA